MLCLCYLFSFTIDEMISLSLFMTTNKWDGCEEELNHTYTSPNMEQYCYLSYTLV